MVKKYCKILLLFTLQLLCIETLAQKCRFDVDKIDAFTNSHTRKRAVNDMCAWNDNYGNQVNNPTIHFEFVQENCKYSLNIMINVRVKVNSSIDKNHEIILKLKNGEFITLKSLNAPPPIHYSYDDNFPKNNGNIDNVWLQGIATKWMLQFDINKEQLIKISENPITDIKIGKVPFCEESYEVDKYFTKDASKTAKCMADLFCESK